MQIRLNAQWICWSRSCHRGKIPMEILSLKCKLIVTGNSNWSQLTFGVNLWIGRILSSLHSPSLHPPSPPESGKATQSDNRNEFFAVHKNLQNNFVLVIYANWNSAINPFFWLLLFNWICQPIQKFTPMYLPGILFFSI